MPIGGPHLELGVALRAQAILTASSPGSSSIREMT